MNDRTNRASRQSHEGSNHALRDSRAFRDLHAFPDSA